MNWHGYILIAKPCRAGVWKWSAEARADNPGADHYAGSGDYGFVLSSNGEIAKKLAEHAVRWRHVYRLSLRGTWIMREEESNAVVSRA